MGKWKHLLPLSLLVLVFAGCETDSSQFSDTPSPTAPIAAIVLTPTATPTAPASPTPSTPTAISVTPLPSLTATPTIAAAPTTTAAGSVPLSGPLIAFNVEDDVGNYLVLFDVASRTFREIRNDHVDYPFRPVWFDNGCHLYTGEALLDIKGRPVWHQPQLHEDAIRVGSWGFGLSWLSPNRTWLAFTELSGEQTFYDAESVNLSVVALEPESIPIRLSSHGGARAAAWTADGQWLAYTDFDENWYFGISWG